jgi:hypothetical protein
MLKRIPKSDISIRPFKAYKEWSFNNFDSGSITMLEANEASTDLNLITTGSLTGSIYPKNSLYGQLRAQFYNDLGDNPFLRTGEKTNYYTSKPKAQERFLSGSAKVISIPNVYVGEGIKKGSVILKDNFNAPDEVSYFDDSFGNIQDNRDLIRLNTIDVENQTINFIDVADNSYDGTIGLIDGVQDSYDFFLDIQNNEFSMTFDGELYEMIIVSMDIESGLVIVENIPFLPEEAQGIKIGNVFYNQGLIVLTRDSAFKLQNDWTLDYKSTQTIYEHEYLLIANEDEFNVSQNPSAVVEIGKVTEFITGSDNKIYKVATNPGVKYIRKKSTLENGDILDYRFTGSYSGSNSASFAGFEHYDLSGSVDSTGSFLTPFITTIGLYDDNCDLVAVAKLPQPIKSEPDIPINFIIRFDT